MASTQPQNYGNFPYFPLPPPPPHNSPPPSHYTPPPIPPSHPIPPPYHVSPPPHQASPPSPPHHASPPPPPYHASPPPPPPYHMSPPPPPHYVSPPPPPSAPGSHSTVIVVVFASLGGLFFLAFLSVALCCFIKKKKKKSVDKIEILSVDEHMKVQEAIVEGPHGEKAMIVTIEEDVHIKEKIKKDEKVGEGIKSALPHHHYQIADVASSSSGQSLSQHHLHQHKAS